MKAVICLLALSAVLAQSAVLHNTSTRQNLNIGTINDGDYRASRWNLDQPGVPGVIITHTIRQIVLGEITAVQANEVGETQYANVFITEGGIGHKNVTVVVQSLRGYGYAYVVDIWARQID